MANFVKFNDRLINTDDIVMITYKSEGKIGIFFRGTPGDIIIDGNADELMRIVRRANPDPFEALEMSMNTIMGTFEEPKPKLE